MTGQGSGRTLSGRRAGGAPRRQIIRLIDFLNRRSKAWACRVVQLTGQAPTPTHPKHLWDAPWNDWYLAGIGASDVVLDLGCGTGTHARRIRATGAVVAATDLDPGAFPDWRAHGIYFAPADASKHIPWPTGFFTVVLALDVIEHVENRQGLLREVRRVLKPGGALYAAVPNRGTTWRQRLRAAGLDSRQDPDHKVEYEADGVYREFNQAGFLIVDMRPLVYDTPWAGLLDLAGALCPPFYRAQARWKRRRALTHPKESTGFAVVARPCMRT